MHYKRYILNVLKDIVPNIESGQKRRLTLVEECRNRWMRNARIQNGEGMPWRQKSVIRNSRKWMCMMPGCSGRPLPTGAIEMTYFG